MSAVDPYQQDAGYDETEILPEEQERDDQDPTLDQEEQEEQPEEQEEENDDNDLFGDDDQTSHPQDAESRTAPTSEAPTTAGTTPTPGTDDGLTSPERRHRKALEYEEDDQEEPQDEVVQLRDANVQIPNVPVPRSSDNNYWVIRLPNFIKFDSKPFHPDMYVGPEHEDDTTGDGTHADALKERSMSIKLEVENTVRWRWVKDEYGVDRKQSNSRIIRWSDGTMSLQLGKELLDVNQNIDTTAAAASRQMGTLSQSQSQSQLSSAPRGQGLTYLVAQHKRAEVLQAEKVITGYLTLRPTGMQSETHRKLVRAVGQKHNKVARLRLAPNELVQRDPDRELAELAKSVKKGGKSGRVKKEEGELDLGRRKSGPSGRRRGMWSDDEEDMPTQGRGLAGSDSEDLDSSPKKGDGKKSERGEYQMDDFVVSDEDEDEDEFGDPKRKKTNSDKASGEKDVLEEAEDRLEEEVRKRKKAKGDAEEPDEPESSDEEDKMDVESEEEEDDDDDVANRKPRVSGATKRRRVAIKEEGEEE